VNNKYEVVIEKLPQLKPYKIQMNPPSVQNEPTPSVQNEPTPWVQNDLVDNKSNNLLINNLDPLLDPISNSLTLTCNTPDCILEHKTAEAEFGEPEREFLFSDEEEFGEPEREILVSDEEDSIALEEAKFGEPDEEDSIALEEAKQQQTSFVDSNSISGEEKTPPAPPRSTNLDKRSSDGRVSRPEEEPKQPTPAWGGGYDRKLANRERAASVSHFEIGLKNKRWKDRADFDKFVNYARVWTKNRQEDGQLNPDGAKYGDGYVNTILSRTASTQDEDDNCLICWKCWNQERPMPEFEVTVQPEPEVDVYSVEYMREEVRILQEKQEKRRLERIAELDKKEAEAAERQAKEDALTERLRNDFPDYAQYLDEEAAKQAAYQAKLSRMHREKMQRIALNNPDPLILAAMERDRERERVRNSARLNLDL
jgi:hypothetical protein